MNYVQWCWQWWYDDSIAEPDNHDTSMIINKYDWLQCI